MCGLFGAIGKYDIGIVKGLALLNESRGRQSAGFFNGVGYCKRAVSATTMLKEDIEPKMFSTDFVCGHTRFATTGEVTTNNAHPFRVGNIVGAHNGVLSNEAVIARENNLSYKVDSEVIFQMLSKGGIKTLKDIRGSLAIWYWDKSDPTAIRLCRNFGNPLNYVKTDKAIYFSSEAEHLKIMLGKDVKTEMVEAEKLYRITPDLKIHIKDIQIGEPYTSITWVDPHPREDGWRWVNGIWVLDESLATKKTSQYDYYDSDDGYTSYQTISEVMEDNGPFYRCVGCQRFLSVEYDTMQLSDDPKELACNHCGEDLNSAKFIPPEEWSDVCYCTESFCDICYAGDEYDAALLAKEEAEEEAAEEAAAAEALADGLCSNCTIVGCIGCLPYTPCKLHAVIGCIACNQSSYAKGVKDPEITQDIVVSNQIGDTKPMFQHSLYKRLTQSVMNIADELMD